MAIERFGRTPAGGGDALTSTDRQFFSCLTKFGPMSRAAIAETTGISRPTASESAQRLLKADIIREIGQRAAGRGRTPVLYDINAERGHTLAIAMEHDWLGVRALNFKAEVVWEQIDELNRGFEDTRLVEHLCMLMTRCRESVTGECLATGFSIADPVDPCSGQVITLPGSPFPAGHIDVLRQLPIDSASLLCIDNDVNWATIAESRLGSMQGFKDFLYVHAGAGIGAGLFLNGQLYRGVNGLAGEIGYTRHESGHGLMRYLAGQGLASPTDLSLDMAAAARLFESAPTSEQGRTVLDVLDLAIGNMVMLLNPSAIVLAGPMAAFPAFFDGLHQRLLASNLGTLLINKGSFGNLAPLVGVSTGTHERACQQLGLIEPGL